jgi:hypothetical protein
MAITQLLIDPKKELFGSKIERRRRVLPWCASLVGYIVARGELLWDGVVRKLERSR